MADPNPLLSDAEWLRRRYEDEWLPVSGIAAEAGADISTVHLWRERHDIPPRTVHRISHARLRRLLESHSVREVARRLKVAPAVVYDRLYRLGLRPVALGGVRASQLRRWYDREGRSIAWIADRLGVSTRTATQRLLAANVLLRPQGRR